ncbi:MAG: DUF1501 domain-containing protein [Verrucomicrobiales bacterium]|nr:DUF1501 domain-containing protein [Verrucomicrobiales bacterium]
MNRRKFIQSTTAAAASALAAPGTTHAAGAAPLWEKGNAEHCVMLWLGGGMAQIDTFDPKGRGDAGAKKPGSYYGAIETSVPGVQVCEHLSKTARLMEHVTAVRSLHHDVVDEHAAAANRMHTGRPTSGTVTYPSLGSIIAHKRGAAAEGVPAYVLLGYPNIARGPGFLGPEAGFIYSTDIRSGPAGLARPKWLSSNRVARREEILAAVRKGGAERFAGDRKFSEYDAALKESLRLSGPDFMKVFNLDSESADLRNAYGSEFGQRCLLARRLFQAGVRFVEVSYSDNFKNGTGWDTHNDGQLKQHLLIQDLDSAISTMITDLDSNGLLEKTVILVNSEFGRPGNFDSGGGRGHQSKVFTNVIAGGGLNHRGAWGASDGISEEIVDKPVSVPDFFATTLAAMRIDPGEYLYDGDRPVPTTDSGNPIAELFS